MKIIRKLIIALFGFTGYLRLISRTYIMLIKSGRLKSKYPELHFLKEIIKPGFVCIDIGANLGYYSIFMQKYAGNEGHVHAVEPIPLFAKVWKKNLKYSQSENLTLHNYALGQEETTVKMGIPVVDGIVHHGMTKVIASEEDKFMSYYNVDMKIPDLVFQNLQRLDFIKCDVEGYERFVFANLMNIINKFSPLIQSELAGEQNRKEVINLLEEAGYSSFVLKDNALIPIDRNILMSYNQDFYFMKE